jgi:hypothetical protein
VNDHGLEEKRSWWLRSARLFRQLLWFLAPVTGLLVVLSAYPLGRIAWEEHKVTRLCRDIRPGTALEQLPAMLRQHGVDIYYSAGLRPEDRVGPLDTIYILVPGRLGEITCNIEHDGKLVTSARMWHDGHWES